MHGVCLCLSQSMFLPVPSSYPKSANPTHSRYLPSMQTWKRIPPPVRKYLSIAFREKPLRNSEKRGTRREDRKDHAWAEGGVLGRMTEKEGLGPWLYLEALRTNWVVYGKKGEAGQVEVAGSCEDLLLGWQASCPGRGLETKGPTYGPEIGEKEMCLSEIYSCTRPCSFHEPLPGLLSPPGRAEARWFGRSGIRVITRH